MAEQKSIRHTLQVAIGSVLFNAMNYPEAVQARILGQDTRPLNDKLTDVLEPVIRRIQADALRDMATRVRAEWASKKRTCPWVGALEDEADRIERGE